MKYKALNCYSKSHLGTLEQKMFTGVIAQVSTYYPEQQLTASLPNILVCSEAGKEAGAHPPQTDTLTNPELVRGTVQGQRCGGETQNRIPQGPVYG